ncbi:MAG: 2-oxoacid:acceptor oxidoreductase family protein [Deltaproteobacteria bacterium]|nr:2-oxoacid:acceptor oxidoreductase family protein [Deltaproteobacteria bacterium]MBW1914744.1 2-oxoacid:acceptor oxidoreductase family protein [Deltaproteobacteria bacterium]
MERCRMVFSGSGGQGIITAAIIFAEAAVLYEGLNAVQSQEYGAAARGGAARSDVIISNSNINYPKVIQPNVLICLTQNAYDAYQHIVRPEGFILTDTYHVKLNQSSNAKQIELPMYKTIMKEIGKSIAFNICVLGAVLKLTDIVKQESVMNTIKKYIPRDFHDLNNQALSLGMSLAGE